MKRTITVGEITALYNAGERDFSEVVCINANFGGLDLRGAIFKDANLSFSNFRDIKLNGADLTGCNTEWSDFTRADLRETKMAGVRAIWCRFNDAHFGKTDLTGSNLSWSVFFKADLYGGAELLGANVTSISLRPEDLTEEGITQFKQMIGSLESIADSETLMRLHFLANHAQEIMTRGEMDSKLSGYDKGCGAAMTSYDMKHGTNVYDKCMKTGLGAYGAGIAGPKLGAYGF